MFVKCYASAVHGVNATRITVEVNTGATTTEFKNFVIDRKSVV